MVRPVVESAGLELVDVAFHRELGRRILRVLVDRDPVEGGLDLETIAEVSGRISRRLLAAPHGSTARRTGHE